MELTHVWTVPVFGLAVPSKQQIASDKPLRDDSRLWNQHTLAMEILSEMPLDVAKRDPKLCYRIEDALLVRYAIAFYYE